MDYIYKTTFTLLIFIFLVFYQEQDQSWDTKRMLLKDANNFAVHDALLQIDKARAADGDIVFLPSAARSMLEETLQLNLGLDQTMTSKTGGPLKGKVEILDFVILDDSNTSFPILFEDQRYNVTKYLNGPAIYAVVKTDYPRLINLFNTYDPITVPTIMEYNPNK